MYDERVIENIECECENYLKKFKKLPIVVNVSPYELVEYKKAYAEGVRPKVLYRGKQVYVPVASIQYGPNNY